MFRDPSSPPPLRRVAVFLGSSPGRRTAYRGAAKALGLTLASEGIGLVYGGGNIGLMGELATATLEAGGTVDGVIPESLLGREVEGTRIEDPGVTRLEVVDSMHARKARMAALADAFIALPGGYGTLEELLEVITWAQLGFHQKPIGLLNVEGFFDPLLALFDHGVHEGFLTHRDRTLVVDDTDPFRLLRRLKASRPERPERWIRDIGQL